MEESKKQSKIIFAVIGVAILLTLTVGLSFAIYSFDKTGGENVITTGSVSMSFTESTNVIDITNALPVQNVANAKQSEEFFEFTIETSATDKMNIPYTVTINEVALDSGYTTIGQSNVHLYLTKLSGSTEATPALIDNTANTVLNGSTSGTLLTNTHEHLAAGQISTTYRLRMWIPYSVDASNWTADTKLQYKVRIDVSGTV